ncbi:MAG: formylglycine-generating enzyme family protein [Candidatus Wallbacteria bacterium]|nr:formylglycine-generating enzyme family protein [Candidatus Wallbacteria bacterium]
MRTSFALQRNLGHNVDVMNGKCVFLFLGLILAETVSFAASTGEIISITIGGSVKMEFVYVPPGEFTMGSPDFQGIPDEHPQVRVRIGKGFYLGKHEVNQEQWQAVMGDNPSKIKSPKLPVDTVSWDECQVFLGKLNDKGPIRFRLPTEAEWEYACRAGSDLRFFWGRFMDGEYMWYAGNSGQRSHEVGLKKPNSWGLYDMIGNVYEWCQDWYDESYYQRIVNTNRPVLNPINVTPGKKKVLRGGSSFTQEEELLGSACRFSNLPGFCYFLNGLRVEYAPKGFN